MLKNVKLINKSALLNNLNFCQNKCNNIMAIVKANAYGHGLKQVVKAIENKVNFWGVSNEKEALKLKKILSVQSNILVVAKCNGYSVLIKNNIHITIDNLQELTKLATICKKLNKCAYAHIAINTGMNRIGVKTLNYFKKMLQFIKNNTQIVLAGIFTHCYNADQNNRHFHIQMQKFAKFVEMVDYTKILVHIGGSFCLNHKLPVFVNMVRCGFFLYGYGNKQLKPVMQVMSKIIKIVNCKKGEYVGYGKTRLKKDKVIAVVPIGYADGIGRKLSNKVYVEINGIKCKSVGKICMDCMLVDITNARAKLGDNVNVYTNADYFAKLTRTSPYEILTNFNNSRCKTLLIE